MSQIGPQRTGDGEGPCVPYINEYGWPPADLTLPISPDYTEIHDEVAAQLIATHPHIKDISERLCRPCVAKDNCLARFAVEQRVRFTEELITHERLLAMVSTSPRWLTHARLQRAGMTLSDLDAITATPEAYQAAVDGGKFDLQAFVMGADNKPGRELLKDQLPELERLTGVSPIAVFKETLLTTTGGTVFSVLECPQGTTNFHGEPLTVGMYRLLVYKMYKDITETPEVEDGEPPIFAPDGSAQKKLHLTGVDVREYRKSATKERLYVSVMRGDGTAANPHRVILLGGHSGDSRTQNNFIDSLY